MAHQSVMYVQETEFLHKIKNNANAKQVTLIELENAKNVEKDAKNVSLKLNVKNVLTKPIP